MMRSDRFFQDVDSTFADAIDELADRLEAGKSVDIDEYVQEFPHIEQRLRTAYKSLERMYELRPKLFEGSLESVEPQMKTLGDFRILRELGRGGMGIVYEAEQISLQRRVALKTLPFAALLDSPQLRRFRTETRAAAMLKHPNIVSVYSIGCERGVHYYAMELIDGPSLADVLSDRANPISSRRSNQSDVLKSSDKQLEETTAVAALSTERSTNRPSFYRRIARLGFQIAEALQYAHVEGVIHRDIKPANLLLDEQCKPHIADFGLARMQSGGDLTMSGDMIGTLRYMSAEQVAGDRLVDQRTDIYSLGLTLYELISGSPAFKQTSRHELIKAIEETDPVALTKIDKHVPTDLATIVHKTIAKNAEDRYQHAGELADDLRRFLEHRTISAKRSTQFERLMRLAKRNPLVATLSAAVFTLLIGISIISTAFAWKYAGSAAKESRRAEQQMREAEKKAHVARQKELGLYARDMRLARLAIDRTELIPAEQLLLKWVPNLGQEDHRGFEWYHLWQKCHGSDDVWTISNEMPVRDVAFSPDGNYVATSLFGGGNNIVIWDTSPKNRDVPVHQLRMKLTSARVLETVRGSNLLIAGSRTGMVALWDWTTFVRLETIRMPKEFRSTAIDCLDTNTSADLIAIVSHSIDSGTIFVWDRNKSKFVSKIQTFTNAWAAFDGFGRLLSSAPNRRQVEVSDPQTGKRIKLLPLTGTWTRSAVSSKRDLLAVCFAQNLGDVPEHRLELRDMQNWSIEFQCSIGEHAPTCVNISEDSSEVAIGNSAGEVLQVNTATGEFQRRKIHDSPVRSLVYSPESDQFATSDMKQHACVFPRRASKLADRSITRCADLIPYDAYGVGFLDEGITVCTGHGGNQVYIWNAHTGKRIRNIELAKGPWNLVGIRTDPTRGRMAIVQSCWPLDLSKDESGNRLNTVKGIITIWDRNVDAITHQFEFDNEAFIHASPLSPDGRYLAVCHLNTMSLVDLETEAIHAIEFSKSWVHTCDFSPDSQSLICALTNGKTQCFDVGTWNRASGEFMTDSRLTECVRFSPNGKLLAACGFDCQLKLFDATTHELIIESEPTAMYHTCVRFSPDGTRVATGSLDGKVRVYLTETAEEIFSVDVPYTYPFCEFSLDGNSLAIVADEDALVIHGLNRETLAPLSVSELREIACKNLSVLLRESR